MTKPDEICEHIDECGELGKISDACFEAHKNTTKILKQARAYKDPDPLVEGEPTLESLMVRLDLIEKDVTRIKTCVESLIYSRSKNHKSS